MKKTSFSCILRFGRGASKTSKDIVSGLLVVGLEAESHASWTNFPKSFKILRQGLKIVLSCREDRKICVFSKFHLMMVFLIDL